MDPEIWAPEGFLSTLLAIEGQMGRHRTGQPGEPRIIDIDLLLFGNLVMSTGFLTLPHPRLKQRAFALVPLAELAPDLVLPDGTTVKSALAALDYRVDGNRILQP